MVLETIGSKEILSAVKLGTSAYKLLKESKNEHLLIFEKIYKIVITDLDRKFVDVEVLRLFDNEEVKSIFLQMIFANEDYDLSSLNEKIELDSIPPLLIPELYDRLKNEIKKTPLTTYIKSSEQNMFLDSIDKTLLDLKKIFIRKTNINKFYDNYKESAIREYSRIKFFGIKLPTAGNRPSENKLDSLYVVPNFVDYDTDDYIELYTLLQNQRIVILGKPGAGKSTLANYLILQDLKENKSIPLKVSLKDYDSFLKTHAGKNLIDFIIQDLNNRFHTSELSRENINDIFMNEFFSFYFDGLDEVFLEYKRSKIRDDIENFSNNYTNNKIIVTSRIVGYKDSPFDGSKFSIYKIANFNDDQISSYVNKWFNIDIPDLNIRNEYTKKFNIEKHSIGKDLLSNPLMLSIILILFTRGFSIPSSRLAIYQSCTETLVDKWEDQKDIGVEIEKKDQAIAHLAYWQYENIPTDDAVLREMRKFYESFQDDYTYEQAEKYSFEFIEYLQKRSIYFNNIFVHKTFLEYYTARYIFTKFEKKGRIDLRDEIIKKHIGNSYWFVVLELLIAMIDKDQADHEVLESLIRTHTQDDNLVSLSFFIKNFRNIENIGKKFRQNFLRQCFEICLKEAKDNYQDDISVSMCSSEVADLHSSFDFLSTTDIEFIIRLIPEYIVDYQFEVGVFFNELENYKDFVNSEKILKDFRTSKLYVAYLFFELKNTETYSNWKEHFPIHMLNTDFSYVFKNEMLTLTIMDMLYHHIITWSRNNHEDYSPVIMAILNSNMNFCELPLPVQTRIPTQLLIDMLQIYKEKEVIAFILYNIYTNRHLSGKTYLTAFMDVPVEYENILIEPYKSELKIASAKYFYEKLNAI